MMAPDWTQLCFVLLCPIGEQHLLSSFQVFAHDGYCLAILVWFVHKGCACKGNFHFDLSNVHWVATKIKWTFNTIVNKHAPMEKLSNQKRQRFPSLGLPLD